MLAKLEGKETEMSLSEIHKDNFICPKGEEHLYHYKLEAVTYGLKGEKLSTPYVQVSGKKFFENGGLHSLRGLGYDVEILHNPREWEKAHEAEILKEKEEAEARKAEAEAKRKEAEKKALFEEFKAQLAEEGLEIVKSKKK